MGPAAGEVGVGVYVNWQQILCVVVKGEIMQRSYPLTISIMLAIVAGSCNSSSIPAPVEPVENTVTLKPLPAVFVEEPDKVVGVVKAKIASEGELRRAQFVDTQNGWAGSSHSMYRTSDGGASWSSLNPKVPDDSWISSFFFIDANHGWLTILHNNKTFPHGPGGGTSILATSDGGNTWNEQQSFSNDYSLNDVSFRDTSNGIAVGGRSIGEKQNRGRLVLALSTNDGGKTWKDISENIVRAIKTPYMFGNDELNTVQWLSPSRILILTRRDRLVVSDDGGTTWTTLVHFEEDRPTITKSGLYKVLVDSKKRMAILGGSMGDEGYWTYLISSDKQDSWHGYELVLIPLLDAIFLSEGEILAVGEEHKPYDEKATAPHYPEGIIVRSKDNGKTWSPLYRTGANEKLISLTRINETEFYAVSDIGTFLKFRLK
jgi:photosystem II stability/assembly factor-like uncharacterized protein